MPWPLYIADLEGDNLWPDVTKAHCAVLKDFDTRKVYRFYNGPEIETQYPDTEDYELNALPRFLSKAIIVMHNGIGYDRKALDKTLKIDLPINRFVDSLKLSQMLYPDIQVPKGWKGKVAPHSIEAWGMRFGRPKPENEEWDVFTPHMLHRCEEDVEILYLTFNKFIDKMKEMNSV